MIDREIMREFVQTMAHEIDDAWPDELTATIVITLNSENHDAFVGVRARDPSENAAIADILEILVDQLRGGLENFEKVHIDDEATKH